MNKRVITAIDPGPTQSAIVAYDAANQRVISADILPNDRMLENLEYYVSSPLAIEMIASYGMAVGASVFETCVWIGRFIQAAGSTPRLVYRKDVKMHLCQSMRAKDTNIRQALIDLHKPTGGGKTPQVGTKSKPGPLFGIKSHLWAALAVAVTAAETNP